MLTPSPHVTDSLTCFSGCKTLFYPFLRFMQCFLSLPWDKYTLLATLLPISCATFAFVLGWKSRERQLATLLGTVDLLLVHSLCESILALACLFLGVYFTVLHTYLFCIASYVRFCFLASGYSGLSGLVFLGGLGVTRGKRPSTQAMSECLRKPRNIVDHDGYWTKVLHSIFMCLRSVEIQMGYYWQYTFVLRW